MLQKKLLTSFLFLSIFFVASTPGARRPYDCEGKVAKALEKYENERYNDVKTILADVKYNCSGHPLMDTALYYLGMAYMKSGAYMDARIEFERLIQDYPRSAFQEEANFRLGYATYLESNPPQKDQTKTKEAIREFAEFIEEFPRSPYADTAAFYMNEAQEKLAAKILMNAKFYEKIERYESAVVYYRNLLDEFPGSALVSEARIRLAEALMKGNRYADAEVVLTRILDSDVSSDIKRKAKRLQKRISREPAGETVEAAGVEEGDTPGTEFTPAAETIETDEEGVETPGEEESSSDSADSEEASELEAVDIDSTVAVPTEEVDLPDSKPMTVDTDPEDSLEKDDLEKLEPDMGTTEAEVVTKSDTSVVVDSIINESKSAQPNPSAEVDSSDTGSSNGDAPEAESEEADQKLLDSGRRAD